MIGGYEKVYIRSSEDAYKLVMQVYAKLPIIDRNKENVWVLCLNNTGRVIRLEHISMGSMDMGIVDPREVFCPPLRYRSSRIIIAHNHPSGILRPSIEDYIMTNRLVRGGRVIDVKVEDSLIFSDEGYFSFLDEGLL